MNDVSESIFTPDEQAECSRLLLVGATEEAWRMIDAGIARHWSAQPVNPNPFPRFHLFRWWRHR